METVATIVWIYGSLVLVGGVMGWVKAKSVPSLVSGLAFGAALIFVGYGIKLGHRNDVIAAMVIAGLLAVIMGARFARSKKFMPAGLVAILSVAVVVALLLMR